MSIGRFMNLALKNLSGYYVKQDRMGTFGYLMPWCLVENESACQNVGWQPYHVQQGLQLNDNAITVGSALMWGNNMAPSTDNPERIMQLMAWDITERCQFALGSGKQFTYRNILLTEPIAALLSKKYPQKELLEQELINTARRPLYERAFANYYANPGSRIDPDKFPFSSYEKRIARTEEAELTETPVWYSQIEGMPEKIVTIPTMKEHMTAFLITGDSARNKIQIMPGGGYATVRIVLPDNWDELMKEKGYAPIGNYYMGK